MGPELVGPEVLGEVALASAARQREEMQQAEEVPVARSVQVLEPGRVEAEHQGVESPSEAFGRLEEQLE